MVEQDNVRGSRRQWAVALAAMVMIGTQLAGAGAAAARSGPVVVARGVSSMNFSIEGSGSVEGAKAAVRHNIDQRCRSIDSRSTGANFRYGVSSTSVSGSGDCVV